MSGSKEMDHGELALLVIDVQQGLFEKGTPIFQAEALLDKINSLVDRAHAQDVPVFYVQHNDHRGLVKGSHEWQLHAQIQPVKKDSIVHKQHPNAFEQTSLDQTLRKKGISRLVICGLVTHGCVKASCLGALELGYRVTLVKDGHSSYSAQAAVLIDEWNQKLGEKGTEIKPAAGILFD
jgi:nicotinamidase-related amidase